MDATLAALRLTILGCPASKGGKDCNQGRVVIKWDDKAQECWCLDIEFAAVFTQNETLD